MADFLSRHRLEHNDYGLIDEVFQVVKEKAFSPLADMFALANKHVCKDWALVVWFKDAGQPVHVRQVLGVGPGGSALHSSLRRQGLMDRAAGLISSSVRSSTEQQYEYPLRRYYSWCSDKELDLMDTSPMVVANFLAKMTDTHNLSQAIVVVYRSPRPTWEPSASP